VQVEGLDSGGVLILSDRFNWTEQASFGDRFVHVTDKNLNTVSETRQRGDAYLREAELAAVGGSLTVPVNCGQQLLDVIDATDARVGLNAVKKRVLGLTLMYLPRRGEYYQRLILGGV
jgi:hypothetical protein